MDNNTEKVYLIKWIGPFDTYESLHEWENNRLIDFPDERYNFYLLQGKKKYAKNYTYYCGQTTRTVYQRLRDKDHHFHDIEDRKFGIWIGRFANITPKKSDINAVEKLITSELCNLSIGYEQMMNQTNLLPPKYDIYIINEWYNSKNNLEKKRVKSLSPEQFIPDLIIYKNDTREMKGTTKIKTLLYLE